MPEINDVSQDVTLALMDEDAVAYLEQCRRSEESAGVFQWFGFGNAANLRAKLADGGFLSKDGGMLAIRVGERAVGRVEWFAAHWGPASTSSCWTIAIGIQPEYRGRGVGTAAQALLVRYLFDHTRAERIQAYTDVENIGEQKALERAGFQAEGTLRRANWRAGEWHDMVLYSVLRGENSAPVFLCESTRRRVTRLPRIP